MRIAQVSPFLPSRAGGSVIYSTNLALQLKIRGHDVEFYAARTTAEDGEILKEKNVAVHTRPTFGVAFGVNPMAFVLPDLLKSDAEVIQDRKSTRLNSSHVEISYAVFC